MVWKTYRVFHPRKKFFCVCSNNRKPLEKFRDFSGLLQGGVEKSWEVELGQRKAGMVEMDNQCQSQQLEGYRPWSKFRHWIYSVLFCKLFVKLVWQTPGSFAFIFKTNGFKVGSSFFKKKKKNPNQNTAFDYLVFQMKSSKCSEDKVIYKSKESCLYCLLPLWVVAQVRSTLFQV